MSSRHVHRIHLTAPSAPLIRRGALLLEDALRVASLPEPEGGRVLVVRSLQVGRIRSHQSSATLAIAIEKRLWQLSAMAIHGEDPAANGAEAVYFRDRVEAYVALICRIARQQPVEEWFWPLAVPDWQPHQPQSEVLPRLLKGILQTTAGVQAGVALLQTLHHQSAIVPLLNALTPQDGLELLQLCCGWVPSLAASIPPSIPVSNSGESVLRDIALPHPAHPLPAYWPLLQPWLPLLRHYFHLWGTEDARSLWLAAIALLSVVPSLLVDSQLPHRAQHLIQRATGSESPNLNAIPTQPAASEILLTLVPAVAEPPLPPLPPAFQQSTPQPQFASLPSSPPPPIDLPPPPFLPTAHSGFFFLLPLLTYLGIVPFLETHPHLAERDFPQHLLHHLAQRVAIPANDPIWHGMTPSDRLPPLDQTDFTAPALWQRVYQPGNERYWQTSPHQFTSDRTGRLILSSRAPASNPQPPLPVSPLLQSWHTAVRRLCRRYAQMGLLNLVHRPGAIAVTSTHIDVYFALDQADIRIRRAGLDLDPGWLPWLGRVVAFHYCDRAANN